MGSYFMMHPCCKKADMPLSCVSTRLPSSSPWGCSQSHPHPLQSIPQSMTEALFVIQIQRTIIGTVDCQRRATEAHCSVFTPVKSMKSILQGNSIDLPAPRLVRRVVKKVACRQNPEGASSPRSRLLCNGHWGFMRSQLCSQAAEWNFGDAAFYNVALVEPKRFYQTHLGAERKEMSASYLNLPPKSSRLPLPNIIPCLTFYAGYWVIHWSVIKSH